MSRLLLSGVYVGASFGASILIVVLIVRDASEAERAAFFLYQAVYFPLFTLLSQSKMLMMFRADGQRQGVLAIDFGAFVLALIALAALGRTGYFEPLDILLYSAALPLSFWGTTGLAQIQYDASSRLSPIIPILTAFARVSACCGAIALGWTPAVSFLAAALAWYVVPAAGQRLLRQRVQVSVREMRNSHPTSARDWVPVLFFVGVGSLSFQWDRLLYSQIPAPELIATTGALMTWALSPVSTFFATIFRADARDIFSNPNRHQTAFDTRGYLRRVMIFAGGAALYAACVGAFWIPLNALAFPFLEAPVWWFWLLVTAIVLDRAGHMLVYTCNASHVYRRAALVKVTLITAAVFAYLHSGNDGIALAYSLYTAVAGAYLVILLRWR